MSEKYTVTMPLEEFDKLRDGLDLAIGLLKQVSDGEHDISLDLAREIEIFLENFE